MTAPEHRTFQIIDPPYRGEVLLQKLRTQPEQLVGRPLALTIVALFRQMDDAAVDWLARYGHDIHALTGDSVVFIAFANTVAFEERLRTRTGSSDRAANEATLRRTTEESYEVARLLSIPYSDLPCLVMLDDFRVTGEFEVVALAGQTSPQIHQQLLEIVSDFYLAPEHQVYFDLLRQREALVKLLADVQARRAHSGGKFESLSILGWVSRDSARDEKLFRDWAVAAFGLPLPPEIEDDLLPRIATIASDRRTLWDEKLGIVQDRDNPRVASVQARIAAVQAETNGAEFRLRIEAISARTRREIDTADAELRRSLSTLDAMIEHAQHPRIAPILRRRRWGQRRKAVLNVAGAGAARVGSMPIESWTRILEQIGRLSG